MTMRVAAFFDIDGTLLACNSARLFARHVYASGLMTRLDVARVAYHLMRYRLGLLSPADILRPAMNFVRGRPESWLVDLCEPWYDEHVRPQVHDRMREIVEEHREQGCRQRPKRTCAFHGSILVV